MASLEGKKFGKFCSLALGGSELYPFQHCCFAKNFSYRSLNFAIFMLNSIVNFRRSRKRKSIKRRRKTRKKEKVKKKRTKTKARINTEKRKIERKSTKIGRRTRIKTGHLTRRKMRKE